MYILGMSMKNDNKQNPTLLEDYLEPQPVLIDDGMWAAFPIFGRKRKNAQEWVLIHYGRQIGAKKTLNGALRQIKNERVLCQSGKCPYAHHRDA